MLERRFPNRHHPFIAVLMAVLLVSGGTTALTCTSFGNLPVQDGVRVLHYDVGLAVESSGPSVSGMAALTMLAPDDAASVFLELSGPRVDSVTVGGVRAKHSHRTNALEITLPVTRPDTLTVAVYYAGRPAAGLYRGRVGTRDVVFTDGWPTRSSGWLPGIHHPSQPATLMLRLSHDPSLTAAASGMVVERGDGTSTWRLDAPAPTYAFAFALAEFEVTRDSIAEHYHFESAPPRGLERTAQIVANLESILGPYPYASLSTVAVPFDYAGMENASSAFLNANLYRDPARLEEVLIHEIVHQWFGNTVTIADWRDLWISEGITTYLVTVALEALDGRDAGRKALVEMSDVTRPGMSDGPVIPSQIERPEDMLTWVVYRKAGAMMHALRLRIDDETFFTSLRALVREATTPMSTESVVRQFESDADEDLSTFFDFWLYGPMVPELHLTWDADAEVLTWDVRSDEGSLAHIDFEIEIESGGEVWYVNRDAESVHVPGLTERPLVRPVGVMLSVRWDNQ